MLKIKKNKWNEFEKHASIFGFKLNAAENAYSCTLYKEDEFPNDYLELLIFIDNKMILIQTSNDRYGEISTDGTELSILYDLIIAGYIEKVNLLEE